ncbi:MAG: DinB family protein [Fimbriimonadaceae bacterium]
MSELKQFLKDRVIQASGFYVQDLEALTHDQLDKSPGGKARSGYDFTHEVIVVNNRIATQLKGEDPGEWPFGEDWAVCPDEDRSKEAVINQIKESSEAILAAVDQIPDEKFNEKFKSGERETSYSSMVGMAGVHMMYHAAQLNYIQSLDGDLEVHWA